MSVWHVVQVVGMAYPTTGIPVTAARWAVGLWHAAQGGVTCRPVKKSRSRRWFRCVYFVMWNESSVWQSWQLSFSCPACGSWWQAAQAVPMPVSRRAVPIPAGNARVSTLWHDSQASGAACLPFSGNAVDA